MSAKIRKGKAMIEYLEGDATDPVGEGPKIIAHCCNNVGGWGSGFVLALSARWIEPEMAYRTLYERNKDHFHKLLGSIQIVPVEDGVWVANIIGQQGVKRPGVDKPIVYTALEVGLKALGEFAWYHGASIHLPRIGCGLAGGSWAIVKSLIQRSIPSGRTAIYVYDFPGGEFNP